MPKKSISLQSDTLLIEGGKEEHTLPLFSTEGFSELSKLWLKVGWNQRHHYSFKWMGLPILQLPDDLVRLQEIVHEVQPDLIIETGIALGGSMLFYASLVAALGHGRVIGIDKDLRPGNRRRLEEHRLFPYLTLIDGDSSDPMTAEKLPIQAGERCLVILDSNHSKGHVMKELELFAPLVTSGSYLIVCDGFKEDVAFVPRGKSRWLQDNPKAAVDAFLSTHPEFKREREHPVTHLTGGILKRQ